MYRKLLEQRAAENDPIRVGIIGAGKFGAGVVAQFSQMQGIEASIIADSRLEPRSGCLHGQPISRGRHPGGAECCRGEPGDPGWQTSDHTGWRAPDPM